MSRVLLVYHNALFALSIHAVLRTASRIHLVGELADWTRVEAEIARLAPDVVLIEEDESTATDAVLGALRSGQSPWRVVALRLDEPTMHVWSGTGQNLQKPQDLYNALRDVPEQWMNPCTARRTAPDHGGR